MDAKLSVRTVEVEFLRPGPAHNQLLSPLTPYLATCSDAEASVVRVPFEHGEFLRRLEKLQYRDGIDNEERRATLQEVGAKLGDVLGQVHGLEGKLGRNPAQSDELVHLRIVLSASELALLPFEASKLPGRSDTSSSHWIALETRPPICVTRRVRTANGENYRLPRAPRILFVTGPIETIPFTEHLDVLRGALRPYLSDVEFDRKEERPRFIRYGEHLTIIKDARLEDVMAECGRHEYTHVHVLAHGAPLPERRNHEYGILLATEDGGDEVVEGASFASALIRVTAAGVHTPMVVTLASCNGADVGNVIDGSASFAHLLHAGGVPLVVASQFPLGRQASIALTRRLYRGFLAGENPWTLLHGIRTEVHGIFSSETHDWASLVVYECLPADLAAQLAAYRSRRARERLSAALSRADDFVDRPSANDDPEAIGAVVREVEAAIAELPGKGPQWTESLGLSASARKRLARIEGRYGRRMADAAEAEMRRRRERSLLERSLLDYRAATMTFLVNDLETQQRKTLLHWVATQYWSLAMIRGQAIEPVIPLLARFSAEEYLHTDDAADLAWALSTLVEVCLLEAGAADASTEARARAMEEACRHAAQLVRTLPFDEFTLRATGYQFRRYTEWWGASDPACRTVSDATFEIWGRPNGVLEIAGAVLAVLDQGIAPARSTASQPGTPPGATALPATPSEFLAGRSAPHRAGAFLRLEMLPADHGDCLWIEYGTTRKATSRLLVDCGTAATFALLRARMLALKPSARRFELFVMTHVDDDHIGGAERLLGASDLGVEFDDVWFNEWKHLDDPLLGARQGEVFAALLARDGLPRNQAFGGQAIVVGEDEPPSKVLHDGLRVTLLSPNPRMLRRMRTQWDREIRKLGKTPGDHAQFLGRVRGRGATSTDVPELAAMPFEADDAAANGSSLALLLEYEGLSLLLGADAYAPVMRTSLERLIALRVQSGQLPPGTTRLRVDAFKVPHHGSRGNLDRKLLDVLDCRDYLVSTNGDRFGHPDREAIARLITYGGPNPRIHFNYLSEANRVWATPRLQEQYDYVAIHPKAGATGLRYDVDRKGFRGNPAGE